MTSVITAYELRSSPNKKPIVVNSYEEAQAIICLVRSLYKRELLVSPETIPDEFDITMFEHFQDTKYGSEHIFGYLEKDVKIIIHPDVVILGMDLGNFEQMDYTVMLQPYVDDNVKLVAQYKEGNEKALNSLMGKFLKDNKGHDAKAIKEALEGMLC